MLNSPASGPAPASSMLATFALLAGAIVVLFALDTGLAGLEDRVRRDRAVRHYAAGSALLAGGKPGQAVNRFHAAVSADRGKAEYQRGLARALLGAGKPHDADSLLVRLLRQDATDGEANLLLARIRARGGRFAGAASHYRRAIYGHWLEDSAGNGTRARLELVELLARRDAKEELLAELLPLELAAPGDTALRRRLAHLFLQAGAPARAAAAFREVLASGGDADAFAGLGRAEFERGNYRLAEANLRRAAELRPTDPGISEALALIATVRGLDLTLPGLGSTERLRRARALVRSAIDALVRCGGPALPDTLQATVDAAEAAVAARVPANRKAAALEARLDLAERLSRARGDRCPEPALDLVISKLSQ